MKTVYDSATGLCPFDQDSERDILPNMLTLLICDVIVLACLLSGLYRWHNPREGLGSFRLWTLLWSQGVLYLALASALDVPASVSVLVDKHALALILSAEPLFPSDSLISELES